MKHCSKCSGEIIPMDDPNNPDRLYCQKCGDISRADGRKEKEASLDFSGVSDAMGIINSIYSNPSEVSLEEKSVVVAQVTATIQDQWFEGFKAGQLAASILNRSNDHDGKNRTESESTTKEHRAGIRDTYEITSDGKDRFREQTDSSTPGRPKRITEHVAGIEFKYDSHLLIPDNVYTSCAIISDRIKSLNIKNFSFLYDGHDLRVVISEFGDL